MSKTKNFINTILIIFSNSSLFAMEASSLFSQSLLYIKSEMRKGKTFEWNKLSTDSQNAINQTRLIPILRINKIVDFLSFSSSGKFLYLENHKMNNDEYLIDAHVWNIELKEKILDSAWKANSCHSSKFSQSDRYLILGNIDQNRVIDLFSKEAETVITLHNDNHANINWINKDGKAISYKKATNEPIKIYDLNKSTSECIVQIDNAFNSCEAAVFSYDGEYLVAVGDYNKKSRQDHYLKVWKLSDLEDGNLSPLFDVETNFIDIEFGSIKIQGDHLYKYSNKSFAYRNLSENYAERTFFPNKNISETDIYGYNINIIFDLTFFEILEKPLEFKFEQCNFSLFYQNKKNFSYEDSLEFTYDRKFLLCLMRKNVKYPVLLIWDVETQQFLYEKIFDCDPWMAVLSQKGSMVTVSKNNITTVYKIIPDQIS